MNGDIIPPKRPRTETPVPQSTSAEHQPVPTIPDVPADPVEQPKQGSHKKFKLPRKTSVIIIVGIVGVILASLISALVWYTTQLAAPEPGSQEKVKLTIEPGSSLEAIASTLKKNGVIKNEAAFGWYVRIEGKSSKLQSGSYRLSKAENVSAVVKHLTSGNTDTFNITFLPGATLSKHRQVLIDAGYSQADVDSALQKTYDGPLFEGKPSGADLEGYIFGETYSFTANATPEEILRRTFKQFESVIQEEKLKDAYAKRGFSLYQGLTLASIIQREVATPDDAAQVAQVFELRLKNDMPLGSDVTYQYIADKTGQPRSVDLDSPYNTRRYKGLPPGPISSPGIDSLKAVGYPAEGDYVYFLSGDDDKTYFARTNEEHERNIRDHCQKKCQII